MSNWEKRKCCQLLLSDLLIKNDSLTLQQYNSEEQQSKGNAIVIFVMKPNFMLLLELFDEMHLHLQDFIFTNVDLACRDQVSCFKLVYKSFKVDLENICGS